MLEGCSIELNNITGAGCSKADVCDLKYAHPTSLIKEKRICSPCLGLPGQLSLEGPTSNETCILIKGTESLPYPYRQRKQPVLMYSVCNA